MLKKQIVIIRGFGSLIFETCSPTPYDGIQQSFDANLKTFENVSYIGELRQRWEEIKKLLKGVVNSKANSHSQEGSRY